MNTHTYPYIPFHFYGDKRVKPCSLFIYRGKAPSLFPAFESVPQKKPKVGPLPEGEEIGEKKQAPEQTTQKVPQPETTDYISFEEPPMIEDAVGRRSPQELFRIIKDLLSRRFNDVERVFFDLDEINSMRLSQEQMFQLLRR